MDARQATGIPGLDTILGGGLLPGSCTMVSGGPGTGKTTLGLQFLCGGVHRQEGGVYFTFEELPEQIYRDAAAFGWDLPALEQAGRLQVICISPEVLLREAQSVDGLLDQLGARVGMRRAVVDSLNLLREACAPLEDLRRCFYLLRNAFRRLHVTSVMLFEEPPRGQPDPTEFVADTLIRLSSDRIGRHRVRHLEVYKHRGSAYYPGQHIFVLNQAGLRLIPAYNPVHDLGTTAVVPTGISRLDQCLGGGLVRGHTYVLNVDNRCRYRMLLGAMIAAHLGQGDGLISGLSSDAPGDLWATLRLFGHDLQELGRAGRWLGLSNPRHLAPTELEPYLLRVGASMPQNREHWTEAILERACGRAGHAQHWLGTADLNTATPEWGADWMLENWTRFTTAARHFHHVIVTLCNSDEMGPAMTSFFQRTADGIFTTWFDGRYQYLQVVKSAGGTVSEPLVMEYISAPPFIALW